MGASLSANVVFPDPSTPSIPTIDRAGSLAIRAAMRLRCVNGYPPFPQCYHDDRPPGKKAAGWSLKDEAQRRLRAPIFGRDERLWLARAALQAYGALRLRPAPVAGSGGNAMTLGPDAGRLCRLNLLPSCRRWSDRKAWPSAGRAGGTLPGSHRHCVLHPLAGIHTLGAWPIPCP